MRIHVEKVKAIRALSCVGTLLGVGCFGEIFSSQSQLHISAVEYKTITDMSVGIDYSNYIGNENSKGSQTQYTKSINNILQTQSGLDEKHILDAEYFTATLDNYNTLVLNSKVADDEKLSEEVQSIIKEKRDELESKYAEQMAQEAEDSKEDLVEVERLEMLVPEDGVCNSDFKPYMAYQAITVTSSYQWQLLNSEYAYTDPKSGIRMYDDSGDGSDPRYCVALGSYFTTQIGQKFDLELEDGSILPCILGDAKADCDTNNLHQYGASGDVAEFIIDNDVYYDICDASGSVNWVDGLSGKIVKVILLDQFAFDTETGVLLSEYDDN